MAKESESSEATCKTNKYTCAVGVGRCINCGWIMHTIITHMIYGNIIMLHSKNFLVEFCLHIIASKLVI